MDNDQRKLARKLKEELNKPIPPKIYIDKKGLKVDTHA